MNLKRCLYLCFFLASHSLLWGQQAERVNLSGSVVHATTDEPIPLAVVNIVEMDLWTTSDKNGNFSFKELKPGPLTVTVSCLGFEKGEYKFNSSFASK